METILSFYSDRFRMIGGISTIFDIFSNFFDGDLSLIYGWLDAQFDEETLKDNITSTEYRKQGNTHFAKKNLLKSWKFYTRSLCWALPSSKQFGLAAANRSAVTFEMKEYHECLCDIELCLSADYPDELKHKVLMRKAECLFELGEKEELDNFIDVTLNYFKTKLNDNDKYVERMKRLKDMPIKAKPLNEKENKYLLPAFEREENKNFAFASDKIRLNYDEQKGRHVVANENIKTGDVLFVEKAFSFAPVFKKKQEFYLFKCFYCLKDVISGIPCRKCVRCIYCNNKCLTASWNESHRWECKGIRGNIWFHLGIAFPAFKTMILGVQSGFCQNECSFEDDLKQFGDKNDNYFYFNRLIANIYKSKNALPYLVMATVTTVYLKKYTDFFSWLMKQPKCPKEDLNSLVKFVGALITKHIAQISNNSSVIQHWSLSSYSDILFPNTLLSTACGIFPSVSMMNHSCKSNVAIFFVCDTIVVKASEDISEGQEVLNSYGINYRSMNKEERKEALKSLYFFDCKCTICADPLQEIVMLDSYLCPRCNGRIPESNLLKSACVDCGETYPLNLFRKYHKETNKYLDVPESIDVLIKRLKVKEKVLYRYHKDFEEIYYKLYNLYLDINDPQHMLKYFQMWLVNEKARKGNHARSIGTKLYEAALAILHCLQTNTFKSRVNLKDFLHNVELMIKEAKLIQNLYYPPYVTDKLSRKIKFNDPSPFK